MARHGIVKTGKFKIVAKGNVQLLSLGVTLMSGQEHVVDKVTEEMVRAKKIGLIDYKDYKESKPPKKPATPMPEKKPEAPKVEPPKGEEKKEEPKEETKEEPKEVFDVDGVSVTTLRAKAKELKIAGYSTKKPADLRKLVKEKLK